MADGNRQSLAHSYVGSFKPDSFSINGGIASAILVIRGNNGPVEKTIKGYNKYCKILQDAFKHSGTDNVVLNGVLPRGYKNPYLAFHSAGAHLKTGIVSHISNNFKTCEENGKTPWLNAIFKDELESGKTYYRVFNAFGDDALSLKDLKDGDRLQVPARATINKDTDRKSGKKEWRSELTAYGAGIIVAAEKTVQSDNTGEPDKPVETVGSDRIEESTRTTDVVMHGFNDDIDDEIPF